MNNYLIRPYLFGKWALYILEGDGYHAKVIFCGTKEECIAKLEERMRDR